MRLKSMFENPELSSDDIKESFTEVMPHSHSDGSPCQVYDVAGEHFGMAFLAQLQASIDAEKVEQSSKDEDGFAEL